MQRYKALHGALALRRFTVSELADYVGVSQNSVHTILNRDQAFFQKVHKVKTGNRGGQPIVWCIDPDQKSALLAELEGVYPNFVEDSDGSFGEGESEAQLVSLEFSSLELAENLVEEFLSKADRKEPVEEIALLCRNQIDSTKILLGQRRLGGEVVSDEFSRQIELVEQRFDEKMTIIDTENEDINDQIIEMIEDNLAPDETFFQDTKKKKFAFVFDMISGMDVVTSRIIKASKNLGFSIVRISIKDVNPISSAKFREITSLAGSCRLIFTVDSKSNAKNYADIISQIFSFADSSCPKYVFDTAKQSSLDLGRVVYSEGGQIVNRADEYDPELVLAA